MPAKRQGEKGEIGRISLFYIMGKSIEKEGEKGEHSIEFSLSPYHDAGSKYLKILLDIVMYVE